MATVNMVLWMIGASLRRDLHGISHLFRGRPWLFRSTRAVYEQGDGIVVEFGCECGYALRRVVWRMPNHAD